jgi:hypothetical protein
MAKTAVRSTLRASSGGAVMTQTSQPLPSGTVLMPDDRLRPQPLTSSLLHARQGHNGAPWHEDYRDLTEAKAGNKLPFEDKSRFDSITFIGEAVELSKDAPAIVGHNGNLLVVVNFGREIGYDAKGQRRTDIATVVLNSHTGEVITVFPGRGSIPIPRS